jgi:hypothetical protein
MVSGFNTSPALRCKIVSGEAKLIVIFEKFDFTLLSFLKAIFLLFGFSDNKNLFTFFLC